MSVTINGTSGVTTPGITNSEGYTGDGLTIAAGAPAGAITINSTYQTFSPNGSEAMRLDASGNLLVGTTNSAQTSGEGLKINESGRLTQTVASFSTNANSNWVMYSTGAGAYRFYVGWDGTIHATGTSIIGISDQTLKTNIRDLETGLSEVMALKPRRFDWKNGDAQNVAGFVAQEVEQVLPELVTDYVYSKDEYGNDIIKKSLKMGDILPTMVKAMQEQQAIINDLKSRIEQLEAK